MMKAAFSGHVGIIGMLIDCGGNPELMDKSKQTALHKAARQVGQDSASRQQRSMSPCGRPLTGCAL